MGQGVRSQVTWPHSSPPPVLGIGSGVQTSFAQEVVSGSRARQSSQRSPGPHKLGLGPRGPMPSGRPPSQQSAVLPSTE